MAALLVRVSLALCVCLSLPAQKPPPGAVIAGVVVERGSNTPIRRAIVTLQTVETRPQEAVAWSDANGGFSFSYLPAGRYTLRVVKTGYQLAAAGPTAQRPPEIITLAAGEVRNDLVFRLQSPNVVSGVVLDEDGDPVPGIQVSALRTGWQRRKRQFFPTTSATTDAAGRYRLNGLAPGRYVFGFVSQNRTARRPVPEVSAGQPSKQYVYGRQFFPGAARADAATVITVEAGREYPGIDFRLRTEPVAAVQGKLVLPPGATKVTQPIVSLLTDDDSGDRARYGVGVSNIEYTFEAALYPAGHYTLVATAEVDGKPYRGVRVVDVPPAGIRDLAIPLEPGVDLAGTVKYEGPGAEKYGPAFVNLSPGDNLPWNAGRLRATVADDSSFQFSGVVPGVWDINAGPIPPDGYIKSMRLGDQDVLTEDMVIQATTSAPLNIVIGTRAAVLEGDVTSSGKPQRYYVLLAPEPKFQRVTSFYRNVMSDEKGHFQMKNVTPGKYLLLAFEEFDAQSIEDPDFLKPFASSAVTVTLKEGDNPAQKVPVIASSTRGLQ